MKELFKITIYYKNSKTPIYYSDIISYTFIPNTPFFYMERQGHYNQSHIVLKDFGSYETEKIWIPTTEIDKIEMNCLKEFESDKERKDFLLANTHL